MSALNSFLWYLPWSLLSWPCDRYLALDQFGWFTYPNGARPRQTFHSYTAGGRRAAQAKEKGASDEDFRLYNTEVPAFQNTTTTHQTGGVLRIHIVGYGAEQVLALNGSLCYTYALLNAILPLVEYVSTGDHFKWLRITLNSKQADILGPNGTGWDVYHTYWINYMSGMLDFVVLNEAPRWELLSQKQPARLVEEARSGSRVSLLTSLVETFDTPSILLGLSGLLLPVLMILIIRAVAVFRYFGSRRMLPYIEFVVTTLLIHLTDCLALLLGDADHLLADFFRPLMWASRWWSSRVSTIWWFTTAGLFLSLLYDKFFDDGLLANLISEPLIAFDTFSQFAPHMQTSLNLTFVSAGLSFGVRHMYGNGFYGDEFSPEDQHWLQWLLEGGHQLITDSLVEGYNLLRQRNVIMNTHNLGCDQLKLTDPLWHTKKYHCYRGYAMKQSELLMLNGRTLGHRQLRHLRRIGRGIVEGYLQRRINRVHLERYHLSGMTAYRFEPHEETDLRQLELAALSRIFIDPLIMLAAIVGASLACHIMRIASRLITNLTDNLIVI